MKTALRLLTNPWLLRITGLACCVIPPAWATAEYFPVWVHQGASTTVSGIAAFLLVLCMIPLLKLAWSRIKNPSIWVVWTILWVLTTAFKNIIDAFEVVTFVAMIFSSIGCLLFWAARYIEHKHGGNT